MNLLDNLKANFKAGSYLSRLIYINLAVFLIVNLIIIFFTLFKIPSNWLFYLKLQAFIPTLLLQPWTLLTYMFIHLSFIHLIFNLLVLYSFGNLFLQYFNQKQLVGNYILGGLAGGILYLIAYNIFPFFSASLYTSSLIGASASIMAILFAVVMYAPETEIKLVLIGNIKLKYLGIALLAMDILLTTSDNAGGNFAHIGGALTGVLFAYLYKHKSIDICAPINYIFDKLANISFKKKPKFKVNHNANFKSDQQYNQERNNKNAQIDIILDKIKKSGYQNLTDQEKKTLFDLSNKK